MAQPYLAEGNTKEVEIQGRKVTLRKFSYAVQKEITALTQQEKTAESIDRFLIASIQAWDLVDENESPLPLTLDNINRLSANFVTGLVDEATKFNQILPEEAKN